MLYPIVSYEDGTEVTASKPDNNGNISLYIEKFDTQRDSFINATLLLPGAKIVASNGYDEKKLSEMVDEYSEIQDDIIGYVMEKVKQSA